MVRLEELDLVRQKDPNPFPPRLAAWNRSDAGNSHSTPPYSSPYKREETCKTAPQKITEDMTLTENPEEAYLLLREKL